MKLLQRTLIYYLFISIPTFILGCVAFYYFLQYAIVRQVDDSLSQDRNEIISFVNNNKNDVSELYKAISCTYFLKPDSTNLPTIDKYSFVYEYDSVEMDLQPFRELKTAIQIKDKKYELVMRESFVDSDSLIYSILFFSVILIGLLTVGIAIINWRVSKRIWNPYYHVLRVISAYQPGKNSQPVIDSNKIEEFRILINATQKMIKRIDKDFNQQKKFIDNVAHELQTPIAIAFAQIEVFMQKAKMNDETAEMISNIDSTLLRLKKINKALLLLSRIHNEQFTQKKNVSIVAVINDYFLTHSDQVEIMNLMLRFNKEEDLIVDMNDALATVLVGNLLSNAIRHNHSDGYVSIAINGRELLIENTGSKLSVDPEQLFNAYVKGDKTKDSLGIGLSIVKEICSIYNFQVSYSNTENIHRISVLFA